MAAASERHHAPAHGGDPRRSFRRLVGEGILGVSEFIRPASQLPAGVLAAASGGAARKGTLAVGADADVVVFDPDAFRDRATYEASTLPSTGVRIFWSVARQSFVTGRWCSMPSRVDLCEVLRRGRPLLSGGVVIRHIMLSSYSIGERPIPRM